MNLSKLDLNLLLVFDALVEHGSVTRAGRRLGLSQPAVSHALNRLRYVLKDKLFERGPDGMQPTSRAAALAEPVRQALLQIQVALDDAPFRPEEAKRTFTVSVHNYAAMVLLPPLAERLQRLAPDVNLNMVPVDTPNAESQLDHGLVDLVFGTFHNVPKRFEVATLLEETYVCVVGRQSVAANRALTLERFAKLPHLSVSPNGIRHEWLDHACKARGIERRIAMTVPNFLAAALVLSQTDMIATVARRPATRFAEMLGLKILEMPIPCPPIPCMIMWHRHLTNQPAHRWLREQLAEIGQEFGGSSRNPSAARQTGRGREKASAPRALFG